MISRHLTTFLQLTRCFLSHLCVFVTFFKGNNESSRDHHLSFHSKSIYAQDGLKKGYFPSVNRLFLILSIQLHTILKQAIKRHKILQLSYNLIYLISKNLADLFPGDSRIFSKNYFNTSRQYRLCPGGPMSTAGDIQKLKKEIADLQGQILRVGDRDEIARLERMIEHRRKLLEVLGG